MRDQFRGYFRSPGRDGKAVGETWDPFWRLLGDGVEMEGLRKSVQDDSSTLFFFGRATLDGGWD